MILEKYVKAAFQKYLLDEGFSKGEVKELTSFCELEIGDLVDEINERIRSFADEMIEEKMLFNEDEEDY